MSQQPVYSEYANDPDFQEILKFYVDALPERITACEEALRSEDYDALQKVVHQIKGSGAGYGFPVVTEKAGNVQEAIHGRNESEDKGTIEKALLDLIGYLQRITV